MVNPNRPQQLTTADSGGRRSNQIYQPTWNLVHCDRIFEAQDREGEHEEM